MRPWRLAFWLAGLVVALAASWVIWRYASIANADLRFAACLAPPTLWALVPVAFWKQFANADPRTEIPGVREQRKAAITLLFDRGLASTSARQSVPFYLVAGFSGVGKSSLLDRSELRLTRPVKIGDATWWVGREAVFVEVTLGSGNLRQAYEVVRNVRPRQTFNGVVLVLSPGDMTLADKVEQQDMAQMTAAALRELEEVTGRAVPVYLALTKVDLLPGFTEFFDRQEQQERSQPWGFTLPFNGMVARPSQQEASDAVSQGFETLLDAIRTRLIEWLSRETDPVRCARINGFATQVAGMQQTLRPVLFALHPESGDEWRGALVRGVYLTSAHQDALSIDGLLPELSRRFAMPRIGMLPPDLGLDEEDHGYFIGGLFRQAFFPEAGLAGRGGSRSAYLAQWAAIAAIVGASGAAGYFVFREFDDAVRRTARAAEITDAVRPIASPTTLASVPGILTTMRRLEDLAAEAPDTRALTILPAFSGYGHTSRAASDAVDNLRSNALAPSLAVMLESQLIDLDSDIDTLLERIALAEDANDPAARVELWLENASKSLPDELQTYFLDQSARLFKANGAIGVDPTYIDAARRIIAWKESLS